MDNRLVLLVRSFRVLKEMKRSFYLARSGRMLLRWWVRNQIQSPSRPPASRMLFRGEMLNRRPLIDDA